MLRKRSHPCLHPHLDYPLPRRLAVSRPLLRHLAIHSSIAKPPYAVMTYSREVHYRRYLHPQEHDNTQLTRKWTILLPESPSVNGGLGKGKPECWMREGMKNMG